MKIDLALIPHKSYFRFPFIWLVERDPWSIPYLCSTLFYIRMLSS